MKTIFPLFLAGMCLLFGTACKEVQKKSSAGGAHLVVHDLPCAEVKKKVLDQLEKSKIPLLREGSEVEVYRWGPLDSSPLPEDLFRRVEEKGRLEFKCIDPISTRLSVQMEVRGLTPDDRWLDITDPEKLSAYGVRFLERFVQP